MVASLLLRLLPKDLAEETRLLWVIGMTLATIFLCDTFKGDFDVLATP
jgi:hypothetical protein